MRSGRRSGWRFGTWWTAGLTGLILLGSHPVAGQEPEAAWPNGIKPKQLIILNLPAPKLIGKASDWLNTDGKAREIKKGEVTLVHFWTFG